MRLTLITILIFGISSVYAGEDEIEFETSKARTAQRSYERAKAKAERDFEEAMEKAEKEYVKDLKKALDYAMSRKNLDDATKIDEVLATFNKKENRDKEAENILGRWTIKINNKPIGTWEFHADNNVIPVGKSGKATWEVDENNDILIKWQGGTWQKFQLPPKDAIANGKTSDGLDLEASKIK